MKTINEAATEHVNSLCFPKNKDEFRRQTHRAYTRGVEFAQRWISVDEELPNKYVVVMAKVEYNSFPIEDMICLCYRYNNEWYFKSNNGLASSMKFTHWRHIELKKTYNGL